jgi:predicted lipid-binding transport protein (Tim44 family)
MTRDEALEGPAATPPGSVPRWVAPFLGVGGAIVGGLYVIFMPVIFAGMAVFYAGVGIGRLVKAGARRLAPPAAAEAVTPPSRRPPE